MIKLLKILIVVLAIGAFIAAASGNLLAAFGCAIGLGLVRLLLWIVNDHV